jgi:hypothetical protein
MSENRLQFPEAPAVESIPGYRAFAVSETFSDVTMLDVRLKSGNRIGLPYPWLARATWEPPEMTLVFTTGTEVTIRGRNLDELYFSVIRHQCVYVCEADSSTQLLLAETVPMVEWIAVKT